MKEKMKNWITQVSKQLNHAGNASGFTLTEMLIVIAVIGLIGTFVASNLINKYQKAKVDATRIQMTQLGNVLEQFKLECGFSHLTDQGLDALLHKPAGGRECKNYDPDGYIKGGKLPKDGFGFDFLYESDGNKFVIKSLGSDGKEGGEGFDKDIASDE